jgi:hypothetical protein
MPVSIKISPEAAISDFVDAINSEPLAPSELDPEESSMEPPLSALEKPPLRAIDPPEDKELPSIDKEALSEESPDPIRMFPFDPDVPSPLEISTSPPLSPDPPERDTLPPAPLIAEESPAVTVTSAPTTDEPLPALISIIPADPPSILSPLESTKEPVEELAEDPLDTTIGPELSVPI